MNGGASFGKRSRARGAPGARCCARRNGRARLAGGLPAGPAAAEASGLPNRTLMAAGPSVPSRVLLVRLVADGRLRPVRL
jgi:hypothetical protein